MQDEPHGGAGRRRFLCTLAGGTALAATPAGVLAAEKDPLSATVSAFVDTLLPRDQLTPAASELGVSVALLAESALNSNLRRLIEEGCAWLDRAARGSFAAAAVNTRVDAITRLSSLAPDESPGRFYAVVRQRSLELYYGHTEAWAGLPIRRPPQPVGYPDHWK